MHKGMYTLGLITTFAFFIYVVVIEVKACFNYWTISRIIADEVGRCFLLFGLCMIAASNIMEKRGI